MSTTELISKKDAAVTAPQRKLVQDLVKQNGPITAVVPEDSDPELLFSQVEACALMSNDLDRGASRLKAVIGRLMAVAKEKPETYTGNGYETFGEFEAYLKQITGRSRSNLQESKRMIEKWPHLDMEDYENIGVTKLLVLAKFTDQSQPGHKKWLKRAADMTQEELEAKAIEEGLITKTDMIGDHITLTGSKTKCNKIRKWLKDATVIEAAGSEDPLEIINAAFEEASTEWGAKSDDDAEDEGE